MKDLEELLRKSILNGFLHLSLDRAWENPRKWRCGYRNTDNSNVRYVDDADPVEAMKKALTLGMKDATLPQSKPDRAKADQPTRKRRNTDDVI